MNTVPTLVPKEPTAKVFSCTPSVWQMLMHWLRGTKPPETLVSRGGGGAVNL
jgi:hypothetical protein